MATVIGTAARADVFEISDQGEVLVRNGGGAVQWVGPKDGSVETVPNLPSAALTPIDTPRAPDAWQIALSTAAAHYNISPHLLAALVWQESRWHPASLSPKGAVGLAQLMPGTARSLAVDARDPAANLDGGAHYLRMMLDRFDGNVERALAAYNAGPGRVARAADGLPRIAETRAYVTTIIDRLTPTFELTGLTK